MGGGGRGWVGDSIYTLSQVLNPQPPVAMKHELIEIYSDEEVASLPSPPIKAEQHSRVEIKTGAEQQQQQQQELQVTCREA